MNLKTLCRYCHTSFAERKEPVGCNGPYSRGEHKWILVDMNKMIGHTAAPDWASGNSLCSTLGCPIRSSWTLSSTGKNYCDDCYVRAREKYGLHPRVTEIRVSDGSKTSVVFNIQDLKEGDTNHELVETDEFLVHVAITRKVQGKFKENQVVMTLTHNPVSGYGKYSYLHPNYRIDSGKYSRITKVYKQDDIVWYGLHNNQDLPEVWLRALTPEEARLHESI